MIRDKRMKVARITIASPRRTRITCRLSLGAAGCDGRPAMACRSHILAPSLPLFADTTLMRATTYRTDHCEAVTLEADAASAPPMLPC